MNDKKRQLSLLEGFWKNTIAWQHPLAVSEIVVWDGLLILGMEWFIIKEFLIRDKI